MIIVGLGLLLLYIYLAYCIIDTHNVSLDNNTMLKKLLAIEKRSSPMRWFQSSRIPRAKQLYLQNRQRKSVYMMI